MLPREGVLTRLGHTGAECDVRHSLVGQTDVLISSEKGRQDLNTIKRKLTRNPRRHGEAIFGSSAAAADSRVTAMRR